MTEPSGARFFADETDLALARALAAARRDVVHPGSPRLPDVPRGTKDADWLEQVGAAGLSVITRDKRIRYRPVERLRWIEHGVRGFCITAGGNLSTWDSLTILVRKWDAIERTIVDLGDGPWMAAVNNGGVRDLGIASAATTNVCVVATASFAARGVLVLDVAPRLCLRPASLRAANRDPPHPSQRSWSRH
jgi:hypothetical protein